ncbi:MAG: nuclear transport factor 2 family protein [Actinomycetota bacterium]
MTSTATTSPGIDVDALAGRDWSTDERANADVVAEFVQLLMIDHDLDGVRRRFGSSPYVQHNHSIPDGIEGLLGYIERLVKRFPEYSYDVRRITVDGDVVTFQSHVTMRAKHRGNDRKDLNIIDSWRVVDGEIGDHWDALQPLDAFMRFYAFVTGGRVRNDNGTF